MDILKLLVNIKIIQSLLGHTFLESTLRNADLETVGWSSGLLDFPSSGFTLSERILRTLFNISIEQHPDVNYKFYFHTDHYLYENIFCL